jgi:hypothetical protein
VVVVVACQEVMETMVWLADRAVAQAAALYLARLAQDSVDKDHQVVQDLRELPRCVMAVVVAEQPVWVEPHRW